MEEIKEERQLYDFSIITISAMGQFQLKDMHAAPAEKTWAYPAPHVRML